MSFTISEGAASVGVGTPFGGDRGLSLATSGTGFAGASVSPPLGRSGFFLFSMTCPWETVLNMGDFGERMESFMTSNTLFELREVVAQYWRPATAVRWNGCQGWLEGEGTYFQ